MNKKSIKTIFLAICFTLLAACRNYSLSINQNQLYNPGAIFTDFRLADSALQHCVDGIIADNLLKRAEQVTHIACGPGSISSIEGLEAFHQLQYLSLANNTLRDIDTLTELKQLKRLDLSNNSLTSIKALMQLKNLEYVNLKGIAAVNCVHISQLKQTNQQLSVELPGHCKRPST